MTPGVNESDTPATELTPNRNGGIAVGNRPEVRGYRGRPRARSLGQRHPSVAWGIERPAARRTMAGRWLPKVTILKVR